MPKQRTLKTAKNEREVLRIALGKVLTHRDHIYQPLFRLDLVTPAMEAAHDEPLLMILQRLNVSVEIHDPHMGTVEIFDHRKMTKKRRFMKSSEWNACQKPHGKRKFENIKYFDTIEPAIDSAMEAAAAQRHTFHFRRRPRVIEGTNELTHPDLM